MLCYDFFKDNSSKETAWVSEISDAVPKILNCSPPGIRA